MLHLENHGIIKSNLIETREEKLCGKILRKKIRDIASYRWNCNATTETIAGVKCDCVLKPDIDQWIIIEITEQSNINKVRDDIIKLTTVRLTLMREGIYGKCYFVMKDKPTDSMRAAGNEQKVLVRSAEEFQNEYFEYGSYVYIRGQKQFGSLINIETGQPENNIYVEVSYLNKRTGEEVEIDGIIDLLKKGKKVVLKGDFGLGKSRCVKQIFDVITKDTVSGPYVISINLRDHWGSQRATEILDRHFADLGMDAKNFTKAYENSNIIYLLDGFDEIGTQSWSSDPRKMQHIRAMSVCALKDLLQKVQGGVLITGREYFFNSDKEMFNSLGLSEKQTVLLECHREFTEEQLLNFIAQNITAVKDKEKLKALPSWLPKRPLVIQLLLKYASDVFSVDYALDDICGFWYAFLSKMCEREAKIYPTLNPEIIKNVLLYLANFTRSSANNMGPISQIDLSNAFEFAAGFRPSDESAIMLQRLPSLGRISADSPDRQFLDGFILNGLRAENIIQLSKSWDVSILATEWKAPLDITGLQILSEYISKDDKRLDTFITMARKASTAANKVLASDIVSALCLLDIDCLDFQDIYINDGYFSYLSFEGKEIKRLTISNSCIERIDLTNSKFLDQVQIKDCLISTVYGVSSVKSIPAEFVNCDIENYETLATTTLIKRANLSISQKLLVEMLRKIFLQPGAGRKEAALLRGMGATANRQLSEKILGKLMDEGLVTRHKGDEGYIYKPVRSQTGRITHIIEDLTLSKDPLWQDITALSK